MIREFQSLEGQIVSQNPWAIFLPASRIGLGYGYEESAWGISEGKRGRVNLSGVPLKTGSEFLDGDVTRLLPTMRSITNPAGRYAIMEEGERYSI
jgi:hypothetical protein